MLLRSVEGPENPEGQYLRLRDAMLREGVHPDVSDGAHDLAQDRAVGGPSGFEISADASELAASGGDVREILLASRRRLVAEQRVPADHREVDHPLAPGRKRQGICVRE